MRGTKSVSALGLVCIALGSLAVTATHFAGPTDELGALTRTGTVAYFSGAVLALVGVGLCAAASFAQRYQHGHSPSSPRARTWRDALFWWLWW